MPKQERFKTNYPGVYYVMGKAIGTKKSERIYYITYRKDGKLIEEKAGRQSQDDMTEARAARIRAARIDGKQPSNKARREQERAQKKAEQNRWTFNRLWEEYKARNPGLKGIVTDENRFNNHIKPYFGDKEPGDLSPLDTDRLRVNLLKKRKPGTVKNVLELLRRLANFAEKKHLCQGPDFTIQMPHVDNLKTEYLLADQMVLLLRAIDEDPCIQAAGIMKMVLFTGMRRGEIFRLKWDDVDFDRGFIQIRDPKGGKGQTIPLNDLARELLMNHPRTESPYVFPGRNGLKRTDCNHQVNRIKARAGLPKDFRPLHGLRHAYASMMASSGRVDLYTLQKLLTHKTPTMTQRYAHLRDEALIRASRVAGELIAEALNGKKDEVVNLNRED